MSGRGFSSNRCGVEGRKPRPTPRCFDCVGHFDNHFLTLDSDSILRQRHFVVRPRLGSIAKCNPLCSRGLANLAVYPTTPLTSKCVLRSPPGRRRKEDFPCVFDLHAQQPTQAGGAVSHIHHSDFLWLLPSWSCEHRPFTHHNAQWHHVEK